MAATASVNYRKIPDEFDPTAYATPETNPPNGLPPVDPSNPLAITSTGVPSAFGMPNGTYTPPSIPGLPDVELPMYSGSFDNAAARNDAAFATQQQRDAAFATQQQRDLLAQGESKGNYDTSRQTAIDAAGSLRDYAPTATLGLGTPETAGFNPTNLQNFDLSKLQNLTPEQLSSLNFDDLTGFGSPELGGFDPRSFTGSSRDAAGNLSTTNVSTAGGSGASLLPATYGAVGTGGASSALDFSKLEGFDPMAALREYAQGAWSDSEMDLKDLLRGEEASAQRGGRLNSGIYDADRGKVITDTRNRFSNAIAQQSLNAAGLREDALKAAMGYRTDAAKTIDQLAADAGMQGQRLTADSRERSADRSQTERIADADRLLERDKYATGVLADLDQAELSAGIRRAEGIDSNTLAALKAGGQLNLDRAGQMDTFALDREGKAATLDLSRASDLDQLGLDKSRYTDATNTERAEFTDKATLDALGLYSDATGRNAARDQEQFNTDRDTYLNELVGNDDRNMQRYLLDQAKKQGKKQNQTDWLDLAIKFGGLFL